MAYIIIAWESDGPNGEAQIKAVRLASVKQMPQVVEELKRVSGCVRVTRERSEGSKTFKTLWIRDGYKDPFDTVATV